MQSIMKRPNVPPSWYNRGACGEEGNHSIEYWIIGDTGGFWNNRCSLLVEKRTWNNSIDIGPMHEPPVIKLYVDISTGDAYRDWGASKSSNPRPVCNFKTNNVYKYLRGK